jgi:N6-adenosine-specific RNA methylase IME4
MSKYEIIYADPAWSYDDACLHRGGALRHYQTMTIEEIKQIPVNSIAAENCALFMWATFPKLQEAFDTISSWGFKYKTCAFVWIKTNRRTNPDQAAFFPQDSFDSFWGMGQWTRSNAEICLLAVKGKPKRLSASVHQVIYAPIDRHSKKPNEARSRIIELCGDIPRVELFAREKAAGWAVWGNQVEASIIL